MRVRVTHQASATNAGEGHVDFTLENDRSFGGTCGVRWEEDRRAGRIVTKIGHAGSSWPTEVFSQRIKAYAFAVILADAFEGRCPTRAQLAEVLDQHNALGDRSMVYTLEDE